jgi:DNA-binding transcriptional LysR family regulator
VETRELRYFVAVAEELHFGRAADRLGMAQPPLSRAIAQLERRLGATLLERSSRAVVLTEAGSVLLDEGRAALDAIDAADRRTRRASRAAEGGAGVVLVSKAGAAQEILAKLLDAYAAEPDAVAVEVVLSGVGEQERLLRDGRADVALLYAPFDDLTGLDHETLLTEQRVALLPRGHRLAARKELRLADLEGETLPRWQGVSGGGTGPEIADVSQMNILIKLGRTIAMLPRSLVEPVAPGLVCVPVADAVASRLVVAWSKLDRRPLVASFVGAALAAAEASYPGGVEEGVQRR